MATTWLARGSRAERRTKGSGQEEVVRGQKDNEKLVVVERDKEVILNVVTLLIFPLLPLDLKFRTLVMSTKEEQQHLTL